MGYTMRPGDVMVDELNIPDEYGLIENLPVTVSYRARREYFTILGLNVRAYAAIWNPLTPVSLLEKIGDSHPDSFYARAHLLNCVHVPSETRTLWALKWGVRRWET